MTHTIYMILLIFLSLVSFQVHAEIEQNIFKSSEFLAWQPKSKAMYIEASVGMASLIAAQNDKAQASCIDDWYYEDENDANTFILDAMKKYPTYHPRGVILGAVEKKCGSMQYRK